MFNSWTKIKDILKIRILIKNGQPYSGIYNLHKSEI